MLNELDLVPYDFNYNDYVLKHKLAELINQKEANISNDLSKKILYPPNFSVDPTNKIAFAPEFDDLSRLHYIVRKRKVTTILEFGVGLSTTVLGNALSLNKIDFFDFSSLNLRRANLYECHSVDNYQSWIDKCKKNIPLYLLDKKFNNLHKSNLVTSEFCGRICTFYDPLPNICPDLIYLDGPDQFSAIGDVRGLSTCHQDRMPMAADILSFEHFLQPGTLIIVDGRTANARFLSCNLQRNWAHLHSHKWDQHFFELQEEPLGIYNHRMLDHCLGEDYFLRLESNNS